MRFVFHATRKDRPTPAPRSASTAADPREAVGSHVPDNGCMTPHPHPFDEAMRLEPDADGRWTGRTSAAYANMIGPFGGTTAAILVEAVCRSDDRLGDPVAVTINYAGAIADGAFTISAEPTRTNRSTQHWSLTLRQDGAVAATATAVTAVRRTTWAHLETIRPDVPDADAVPVSTRVGRMPWTSNYEMRVVRGEIPALAPESVGVAPTTWVWVRDVPPRPLDFPSLTAICDAYFPRIFYRRPVFVPIGTVSLTIYFHRGAAALAAQGDRAVLGIATASNFADGFFEENVEVWGDDRRLLATAHQIVYFKE